jgi:hypothetical protein
LRHWSIPEDLLKPSRENAVRRASVPLGGLAVGAPRFGEMRRLLGCGVYPLTPGCEARVEARIA